MQPTTASPVMPSDVLAIAIFGGLFLFFVWMCVRAAGSFDAFMRGVAWVIGLAVVAIILIAIFQVGYPGQ